MLVNRTFSKAYGLAGFRIGYVLCDPKLAIHFNKVRFPWNVSLIALAAALAGLDDAQDQNRSGRTLSKAANISMKKSIRCPVCALFHPKATLF